MNTSNWTGFILTRLLSKPAGIVLTGVFTLAVTGCSLNGFNELLPAHADDARTGKTRVTEAEGENRAESLRQPGNAPSCCDSLRQLPYRPLAVDANIRLQINSTSPVYHFPSGRSYFSAFKLPVNSSSFRIELQSLIGKTLFEPTVMMLDGKFAVTRILGNDRFKYVAARGFKGDSIDGKFRVDRSYPGNLYNETYMIIYTTKAQMSGQTTLVHPAKAFAIAQGNQPPAIADPVVDHTGVGTIKLSVIEEQNKVAAEYVPGRSQQNLMDAMGDKGQNQVGVAERADTESGTNPTTILPETKAFYKKAVAMAVSEGNLDRALKLVEESQRLGIAEIRQYFLELLKN
ncbi:MalM family protein [Motiliproteus sp. MSK22-1]|uniref:MalM family protein n=1 Tax=Motiliproteus sp. MSK22-1 TaxID=1897630 RepID=UPI00097567B3|nr:MalM family protein [Motiliproteus sp. MSK22-1]OMH29095.1 hypothetical protein BGP75_20290 [Motiliproteus sp. MSK22-1]